MKPKLSILKPNRNRLEMDFRNGNIFVAKNYAKGERQVSETKLQRVSNGNF